MLRFGIPAYRLPRNVLAGEAERIQAMGVKLTLAHRVENLTAEMQEGGFEAAFVAIGAQTSQHIDIPAPDAAHVLEALSFLRDVSRGERPRLGRRVVVYGGGNTAMDAARTAMRLGGTEPLIIYRRDRAHMPAQLFEAAEAEEEGVRFQWLTRIRDITGGELTLERMELDAAGRLQATGELEKISADAVVLAIGQRSDSAFLSKVPGVELTESGQVMVGPDLMTRHPGIFAGGDLVSGERTVTGAVGHGRRAALNIDAWLRGTRYVAPPEPPLVSHVMLHLPIYTDVLSSKQGQRPPQARVNDFGEVVSGLTADGALHEARRCFSCGHCFECDACYASCPERAITKRRPGQGYDIRYERCTGCAVCFETCPCHAIDMVPEQPS
jgi:thioredoxin reductase/Pyruvate/2-oxoacid:ferredoxin oxidoreductase delta subunit